MSDPCFSFNQLLRAKRLFHHSRTKPPQKTVELHMRRPLLGF